MKNSARTVMLLAAVLWLSACSEQQPPPSTASMPDGPRSNAPAALPSASAPHGLDARLVARGGDIYKANCAVCHGANAEGALNWQRQGPDGKRLPPPLDASGHAWHHPSAWLRDMIKQGTVQRGGNMPSWQGKLSNDDIEVVIAWIHSRWPEEIYRSWLATEEKARKEAAAH